MSAPEGPEETRRPGARGRLPDLADALDHGGCGWSGVRLRRARTQSAPALGSLVLGERGVPPLAAVGVGSA